MSILTDRQIRERCKAHVPMIENFREGKKKTGFISFGLTSMGYDVRLDYDGKIFSPIHATEIDPKNFNPNCLVNVTAEYDHEGKENYFLIPPHSFMLGQSIEKFNIPDDILVVVVGKSTYARCGIIVNVTPGEPEWSGIWTIEISNTTPLPVKVYAGEGIMQALFLKATEPCEKSYAKKKGKYQHQSGLTLPKAD